MKKMLILLALGMVLGSFFGSAYAYEAFRGPTELIYYDKAKADNGYVLFWPMQQKAGRLPFFDPDQTLYMIDMDGNVVHTWPGVNVTPFLYPDGLIRNPDPKYGAWVEMDWNGNIVPLFPGSSGADHKRIWNKQLGQYTYIGSHGGKTLSYEDIVAAGGDPALPYDNVNSQTVIEYDGTGTIIWQWRYIDHVIQDRNPDWPNYVGAGKTIADYPGKLNLFHMTDAGTLSNSEGPQRDWQHMNSEDYDEDSGLFAFNSKHWSEFYVVDHDNTFVPGDPEASIALAASDAGDFVYRFGKPSAYGGGLAPGFGTEGNQNIYGAHDIQWIRPYHWERPHPEAGDTWADPAGYTASDIALPGAGNFLIFSNGCYSPRLARSEILEINPFISGVDEETGEPIIGDVYVFPSVAGFKSNGDSNQIVWQYRANYPNSFFSQSQSGMQRLPNGNTFICSANSGHLFQVTPEGEVVWEYISPWDVYYGAQRIQTDQTTRNFDVFRAYWYSPDYPGLEGRDLTPMGTITERAASGLETLQGKLEDFIAQ